MKKEPIILKVKQKTFKQIKTLNLDLKALWKKLSCEVLVTLKRIRISLQICSPKKV